MEAKANELRINNLLRDKVSKTLLKVIELNEKDIVTYVVDRSKFPLQKGWGLEPIPLTEEILLKCGFYKDEIKRQSKQHSAYYSIEILDYKYSFAYAEFRKDWGFYHSYTDAPNEEDNNGFDFISCGIKYLHQLQNLYFALTNEELTVNL